MGRREGEEATPQEEIQRAAQEEAAPQKETPKQKKKFREIEKLISREEKGEELDKLQRSKISQRPQEMPLPTITQPVAQDEKHEEGAVEPSHARDGKAQPLTQEKEYLHRESLRGRLFQLMQGGWLRPPFRTCRGKVVQWPWCLQSQLYHEHAGVTEPQSDGSNT